MLRRSPTVVDVDLQQAQAAIARYAQRPAASRPDGEHNTANSDRPAGSERESSGGAAAEAGGSNLERVRRRIGL